MNLTKNGKMGAARVYYDSCFEVEDYGDFKSGIVLNDTISQFFYNNIDDVTEQINFCGVFLLNNQFEYKDKDEKIWFRQMQMRYYSGFITYPKWV